MLPEHLQDFRASSFWDSFTDKLDKPFEWYLKPQELWEAKLKDVCRGEGTSPAPLVLHVGAFCAVFWLRRDPYITPAMLCFQAGCGNSDLSSYLSRRGVPSINVDFSLPGLVSLARSGAGSGQVSSGEAREAFADFACVDCLRLPMRPGIASVVLDKGLLDAMMGEDDTESRRRTAQLLNEFARALGPVCPGFVVIVTLAQEHIVSLLGSALLLAAGGNMDDGKPCSGSNFQTSGNDGASRPPHAHWASCTVQAVCPERSSSPLQPFVVTLERAVAVSPGGSSWSHYKAPKLTRFYFVNVGESGTKNLKREAPTWGDLSEMVREVQADYAANFEAMTAAVADVTEGSGSGGPTHVLFEIDLKPEDEDTDLEALAVAAMGLSCHEAPGTGGGEGLRFSGHRIEPVGFGLCKVVLEGTLPLEGDGGRFEDLGAVCEALGDLEGASHADEVESHPCSLR